MTIYRLACRSGEGSGVRVGAVSLQATAQAVGKERQNAKCKIFSNDCLKMGKREVPDWNER